MRPMHRLYLGLVAVAATASSAIADPCEAPLPKAGTIFSGQVRYVGDGDSFCIGPTADPKTWIEVRVADFYAPELHSPGGAAAKAALERIALGKRATCSAGKRSYDRIVAACTIGERPIGALLREAGIVEGGRGR